MANNESDDPQVALVQTLFLKHSSDIQGYLFALSPDGSLVDDLLHAVFLCVTAKADQFQEGTNFLAWARAIAKIEVLRLSRENQRGPRALAPEVIEKLCARSPVLNTGSEWLDVLRRCIQKLAPRAKQALTLRYYDELKPPEIARRMALAVDSVNVTLSRARAAVRQCMQRSPDLRQDQ